MTSDPRPELELQPGDGWDDPVAPGWADPAGSNAWGDGEPRAASDQSASAYWQPPADRTPSVLQRFEVYDPRVTYEPQPTVVPAPRMPASVIAPGVLWMFGSAAYGLAGGAFLAVLAWEPQMAEASVVLGLIFIAIMAIGLWTGFNMLRGHNWARIFMTCLTGMAAASSALALMTAGQNPDPLPVIFGVVIPLATLIPMWLPSAGRFFKESKQAALQRRRGPRPMR